MPGQPTFSTAASYQDRPTPGAAMGPSQPSHMAFIVWVIIIGILLPAAIIGGLNVGGFKFVFRGRG